MPSRGQRSTANGPTSIVVTHDRGKAVTLVDRGFVISARPGGLKLALSIDLPRPRDLFGVRSGPRFGVLNQTLSETFQDDVRRGEDVEDAPPA